MSTQSTSTWSKSARRLGVMLNDPFFVALLGFGLIRLVIPESVIDSAPNALAWLLSFSGWAALCTAAAALTPWLRADVPESSNERAFWALWSGALLLGSFNWVLYTMSASLARDVMTDIAWGASSSMLLVALTLRPHEDTLPKEQEGPSLTDMAAAVTLVCGLLLYFVGISSAMVPMEYESGRPSYYLYILLDLVVLGPCLNFWLSSKDGPWSATWGLLTFAFSWSLVTGVIALSGASLPRAADILWYPSLLGLVVVGHGKWAKAAQDRSDAEPTFRPSRWNRTSPGLFTTLVFLTPVVHILFSIGGNLDPAAEKLRGIVAVALAIAFFYLAALRQRVAVGMWSLNRDAIQWLPRLPAVLDGLNRIGVGILLADADGNPIVSDSSWGGVMQDADTRKNMRTQLRPVRQRASQTTTGTVDASIALEMGRESILLTLVQPKNDGDPLLALKWEGEARRRWASSSGEVLIEGFGKLLEELAAELSLSTEAVLDLGPDVPEAQSQALLRALEPVALGLTSQEPRERAVLTDILEAAKPDLAIRSEESVRVDSDPVRLKAIFAVILDRAFEPSEVVVQEIYLDKVTASELGVRAPGTHARVSARVASHEALHCLKSNSLPVSFDLVTLRLLLADQALRRMGGAVIVDGLVGVTGEMLLTVILPVSTADRARKGSADASTPKVTDAGVNPPPAEPCGHTILIVDDDIDLREILDMCVRSMGYETVLADSGEQALDLLTGGNVQASVVLTDQDMGGISGSELLNQIRPIFDDLPVVLMTGHPTQIPIDPGTRTFDAMLPKPFRLDELERCLLTLTTEGVDLKDG